MPKWREGLLAHATRPLVPTNIISWLSVSFVLFSVGKDLWGKGHLGPTHVCSTGWYILYLLHRLAHGWQNSPLFWHTFFEECAIPRLAAAAIPAFLPGWLWTASWSPLVALPIFTPSSHTLWGREKMALKGPPRLITAIHHPLEHPMLLDKSRVLCVESGLEIWPHSHSLHVSWASTSQARVAWGIDYDSAAELKKLLP
jgi:hypothetical protein